ncbi:MAG: hypothetical protein EBR41_03440 [Crocinitomicaceae bacterium]|nr:hypothetical protein [Crocinitomicaceae bacterium]
MDNISQILEDRIINGVKHFDFYKDKYKISKEDFNSKLKNLKEVKSHYSNEIIIKAFKLFDSKIIADKKIFEWNKKNPQEIAKIYSFSAYSRLDENGKSIKTIEDFRRFYLDIKKQYYSQTKSQLQNDLPWIVENSHIKQIDCVCYYCGIDEQILSELYNDQKYTCKTKRNRGAWFELDRRDSSIENNVYSKDNMVLCCYFCNNHKSDVISSYDMRGFFGEQMFLFLIDKYESIIKTK